MSLMELSSAIEYYRRMDSGEDLSVHKYRSIIACLVGHFLTDLDIVAQKIEAFKEEYGSVSALIMCGKCLRESPDVCIIQASQDLASPKHGEASLQEKTSHAFCFWFLRHLLRVLSCPGCSKLHVASVELIVEVLHSVQVKSKYVFRQYLIELISAAADLVQLSDNLYKGHAPAVLDYFKCNLDLVEKSLEDLAQESQDHAMGERRLRNENVVLTDTLQAEYLQTNLATILHNILPDIVNWATSHVSLLWGCLCCYLETGDCSLKVASMKALVRLVCLKGLPPEPLRDYFLTLLLDLWELLCTSDSPLTSSDRSDLELTAALFTSTVIDEDKCNYLGSRLVFLHTLVERLCPLGLTALQCLEAKWAVVRLFLHVLPQISTTTESSSILIHKPSLDNLTDYVLEMVVSEKCSQYLVPLLVRLTLLDIYRCNQSLDVEMDVTLTKCDVSVRKQKVKTELPNVKMASSPIFAELLSRISGLSSDKMPSFQQLEGLHVALRVASECLSHHFGGGRIRYSLFCESLINMAIGSWTSWLFKIKEENFNGFPEGYRTILLSISAVLTVQDVCHLSDHILQEMTWMTTLCWMSSEISWKDLKPLKAKDVALLSSNVVDRIDTECLCLCLRTMSFLPGHACPAWKIHVMMQVASDSRDEVRQTLAESFPIFLHNLGSKSNYLVAEIYIPLLDASSSSVKAVADRFGEVILSMADAGTLQRTKSCNFEMSFQDYHIVARNKYDKKLLKEKGKYLDPHSASPFIKLLKHSKAAVRKSTLHSLASVFSLLDMGHPEVKQMVSSCLDLLEDHDTEVAMECCRLIPFLVSDDIGKRRASPSDYLIWKKLEEMWIRNYDQNSATKEALLMAIGQFGRLVNGELLESAIIFLLQNLLEHHPVTDAIAYEELQWIEDSKGESLHLLYGKCKPGILKFLAEAMYTVTQGNKGDTKLAKTFVTTVASSLRCDDCRVFLQGSEKYMLPFLVSKASPETSQLIKLLISLQSSNSVVTTQSQQAMLINNTKYIFSYLVRTCQKEEMEKAFMYLQTETEFSLGILLQFDFQRVHNELLLYLSTHYHQVYTGLKILAEHDEQNKGPKRIESEEQMAQYLEPRLLAVLLFFDSQLMNASVTLEDKELAMESLISIIRLTGSKHFCHIRYKVMNTLRLGLRFTEPSSAEISCRAWDSFVRSLDLPLLGDMMAQIVATLLPVLKVLPAQVAHIFNYMIVENKNELSSHFHEIYFLPDIPELAEANKILKQFGEIVTSNSDLRTLLAHSIKGISHESHDVRAHALPKLRKILKDRQAELNSYVLGSETAEPIVSDLVTALMSGCRDRDSSTQILYGQCLGELGAIDPGRLELMSRSPDMKLMSFHPAVSEDNFACELINMVVKAFLAASKPGVQDNAAFVLQELLQIYDLRELGDNQSFKPKGKLWDRFSDQTKEILLPLLNSKYKYTHDAKYAKYPKPLYQSKEGNNFVHWVSNWTGYLILKLKPSVASRVFSACRAITKHMQQVALFLLPHIVLHVLQTDMAQDVKEIHEELMAVLQHLQEPELRQESPSSFHHMSAQTVFSILDYLTMWRSHQAQSATSTSHQGQVAAAADMNAAAYEKSQSYVSVDSFLKRIPQDIVANASFNCQAYTRALRHFDMFVSSSGDIQQHLDFMQRIYVALDEPDGVLGAAAVRVSPPTLMQQILSHESLGQQEDAQTCYERAIQMEPDNVSHRHGLLKSLMDLARPNITLSHTAGILAERHHWTAQLNSYRIEAAWKLGSWEELDKAMKVEQKSSCNWPVLVGRTLLAYKNREEAEFIDQLQLARKEQMGPLSAASMEIGSYHRGYENILRLHMINEIEEFFSVLVDFPETRDNSSDVIMLPSSSDLLSHWQARIQMVQPSFRIQEPILTLRRTLLTMADTMRHPDLDMQVGQWWLWSAKVARKAGYMQSAYSCLLQAKSYKLPEFHIEQAKWLYDKGQADAAIACLEKGISQHFGNMTQPGRKEALTPTLRQVYAESLLLFGKFSEERSSLETNAIFKQYKDVIEVCPNWEDGYFHLGKYYDKIMNTMFDDKDKQGELITLVVNNYGMSLKFGSQHIYQSLPRLLSLWLDYGTAVMDLEKRERGKQSQRLMFQRGLLKKINGIIESLNKQLAPYQMFTAFPQLISRICHANIEVFQQLEEIIACLLVAFPHQAMWMMMAVSKSSYHMRVTRCSNIFAKAIGKNGDLAKFIQDCKKLTDRLLELCEKDFGNSFTVSLSQSFKPLKRLLEDSNFSQILLPLQSLVTVTLPSAVTSEGHHNPFPDSLIYIKGFGDTIEVMQSLAKPKKITMIGSDGRHYVMMCKPKDDLRKDCRLMEFNTIVNRFLRRDAECRKRQLFIRTYTVTPLNEECGLLQWVNNTTGLRNILVKLYREKGIYMTGKELKACMPALQAPVETKMKLYKEKLLPRHPPLFPEWFNRTFPDPTSWYSARVAYARTAAVMSIVGYILGLGDRHGENILFDSTTGDCVHVDFNCLFNKGETFEWPERVPFRLTHNMAAALGPLRCEGLFRRACEITLKVIRDQMDPLMSVLRPFIYDPLVEWSKSSKAQRSSASDSGEINNEYALIHVQNIEDRMRGILKTKSKQRGLPLSIEGHVKYLIQEATSEINLCQMYIGWAAYM